jgi:Right handed beta helix region
MRLLWALALAVSLPSAAAAPSFVATFHAIGLYWSPAGGSPSNAARVEFREVAAPVWRRGLDLWFDERNAEYRGSLVELKPGTVYQIRLTLAGGSSENLTARTWSETLRVKRTVEITPGTTHLVIDAADSGDEKDGYVLFTGPPGGNVIDQDTVAGNGARDSCVVVKQGAHHVIIRGLVLRNCKRYGVLIERQSSPVLHAHTRNIVIEDNEILGWGGFGNLKAGSGPDTDGAVHCNYYHETDDAKRPDRIIIQRNRIHDPRHGANPWQPASGPLKHPGGPNGVTFERCGRNHVIRYNDIYSTRGNHYMDGIGGGDNFSAAGFPYADSDIYGNRISEAYDDGIEAEGANRNVRIWANYLDRVFVAIGNAATATGPLYVWRNVSHRMGGMYHPAGEPDGERRGPFIKAGSNHPTANGGRAYYFHNTVLQPPGRLYTMGAGEGITNSGGMLYNFVSRNNIWHIHKEPHIDGQPKFGSLRANGDRGPVDADFDLYSGRVLNAGTAAERRGWRARPVYASSGSSYPNLAARPGSFMLMPGSPGHGAAERIPNFNDTYARPDVGAHQSETPPMKFGAAQR